MTQEYTDSMMQLLDVMNSVHGDPSTCKTTSTKSRRRRRPSQLGPLIINNTAQNIDHEQLLSNLPSDLLNNCKSNNQIIIVNLQQTSEQIQSDVNSTVTDNPYVGPIKRSHFFEEPECKRYKTEINTTKLEAQSSEVGTHKSESEMLSSFHDILKTPSSPVTPCLLSPISIKPPTLTIEQMYQMSLMLQRKVVDADPTLKFNEAELNGFNMDLCKML
ncbi:autophagy-related protein 2 [Acrasis kona]|uniref:Autophagy-related protein 2 n=1 Tax=Acrasis kona TaxID=1008807 RepID=A0AAW2ZEX6_9EUKA